MFNIAKLPTKGFFVTVFIFSCCNVAYGQSLPPGHEASQEMPSRLELRAMQTRKFIKGPLEVQKAIIEFFKDYNAVCSVTSIKFSPINSKMEITSYNILPGGVKSPNYEQKTEGYKFQSPAVLHCSNAEFEISAADFNAPPGKLLDMDMALQFGLPPAKVTIPGPTIVRARITVTDATTKQPRQSYSPARYQRIFKFIADGLFIDAVELTPAEMQ
jgi:hypothetical protein